MLASHRSDNGRPTHDGGIGLWSVHSDAHKASTCRHPLRDSAHVQPPRIEPSGDVVARVASTALALPDAYEEDAWTGVRWRVRSKTFAHVLVAQQGYTSAYREITGVTEPTIVLTFRLFGDELAALANAGPPLYRPPWSPTAVGMVLDDDTDWDEVAELVTESYRFWRPRS